MPKHTCHATGCDVSVPPRMFMCRRHWYMLPKTYRDRVWSAFRPGQEDDKNPSATYTRVAMDAIRYLEALEASER